MGVDIFLFGGVAIYAQTAQKVPSAGPEKPSTQNQPLPSQFVPTTPQSAPTQQAQQQPQQQAPQAQPQPTQPQRPRMLVLGVFDAGQPGVGIFKMFDPSDQVLCYVLMPETAGRKAVGNVCVYDGNSVGSISCVKVDVAMKKDNAGDAGVAANNKSKPK